MPHPQKPIRFSAVVASLLALAGAAGCGPNRPATIEVNGIVTLDGQPVVGASVLFSPADGGHPATGVTDAQGEFELQTFAPGDGALPGTHNIAVTLNEVTGVAADPDGLSGEIAASGMQVRWIVPEKYANPKTSELSAEVNESTPQPLRLQLTTGET